VKSQWHTFLFLNKGVRQKRSLSEVSEYEYNLRLVEVGLGLAEGEISRRPLQMQIDPKWQDETLSDHGIARSKYSVVHPGMSGSARNWPTSQYISWIQEAARSEKIVITGTASDEPILEPIRQALAGTQNVVWLDGKLSEPMLLHVLAGARVVLAPSTGVAHLAASLGRPVIGIYSPVKVQHPKRWGPQGNAVQVLVPDVECPGKKACLGTQCPQYDCMTQISLESVRAVWSPAET
jgi:ADP-heptose:LPS heptosyltransferase